MKTPLVDREGSKLCAELMGRYCDGDVAAFHQLYRRLSPGLLGYLTKLSRERATAEDLLQVTFMKLHQGRRTYVRGADPLPWLYTIARTTCLDELRRRRRSKVQLAAEPQALPDVPAHLTGISEVTADESPVDPSVTVALSALTRLPPQQRAALVMTKVEGRSLAEAAAIAGTTVGAVKLRIHRGYTRLRRMLGARGGAEATPR